MTEIDIREGKGWRIMTFSAYRGEELLSCPIKWFNPRFDKDIEGVPVNIYFTFPQHWDNASRFEKFDLTVADIEKCS